MAKSMVDEILAAEAKAKEIVAMAKENAKTAKDKATADAAAIVENARATAEKNAEDEIAKATENANAKQAKAHGEEGFIKEVLQKETGSKYDIAVDAAISKLRS